MWMISTTRRWVQHSVLLWMGVVSSRYSLAQEVLPPGTVVTRPTSEPERLLEAHYILTRDQVEDVVRLSIDLTGCRDQLAVCETARVEPLSPPHQESASIIQDVFVYGGGAILLFAAGYGTSELVRAVMD